MTKIFDKSALSILPLSNGMIFAFCQDRDEDQMTVAYREVDLEKGTISKKTADYFNVGKFGVQYKSFLTQFDNPVTCKSAFLPNGNILVADDKGNAKIINREVSTVWSGSLTHRGSPVSGIAVDDNSLWCSYKDSGVLVRYNTRTMRDELRLGGGKNTVIAEPKGIYIKNGIMRVCDCSAGKIYEINLNTYAMNLYREFDEPVHQYIKVNSHEIVLLESGIYVL